MSFQWISDFVGQRLDYALLCEAVVHLVLFEACLLLMEPNRFKLPWKRLALFGLFGAISNLTEIFRINFEVSQWVDWLIAGWKVAAYLALFEFARLVCQSRSAGSWGKWLYALLAPVIIAYSFYVGGSPLHVLERMNSVLFEVGAPLLTAIAVFRFRPKDRQANLGFLGICASFLVMSGDGFVFGFTGPVPTLVGILADIGLLGSIWLVNRAGRDSKRSGLGAAGWSLLVFAIALVGGALTDLAGRFGVQIDAQSQRIQMEVARRLLMETETIAENLVTEVSAADQIVSYMMRPSSKGTSEVDRFLQSLSRVIPDSIIFVMNERGECLAASNDGRPGNPKGRSFALSEFFKSSIQGNVDYYFAMAPTLRIPALTVSVPILANGDWRDPEAKIVGVAAIVLNFRKHPLFSSLEHYGFLVDSHGIILNSGRRVHEFWQLWPNPEETLKRLEAEGRYKDLDRMPVLEEKPVNGKSLRIGDRPFYALKQDFFSGKISLIYLNPAPRQAMFRTLMILVVFILEGIVLLTFALRRRDLAISRAHAASARQYRAMFEDNAASMLLVDPATGLLLDANRAACNFYGLNHDQIVGRSKSELFAPAENDGIRLKSNGVYRKVIMTAMDIEFREQPCRLESFVDVSEIEAVQQQLMQVLRKAEAANQAKSQFLATMSHEIRTPMNGVIGMTDLLLETPLDEEQRDFAETLKASAQTLLGIINDILDFSKIEADKLTVENIAFDLRPTVEGVGDLFVAKSAEKNLDLTVWIEPTLPDTVTGDPGRLKQVLINLVGNAMKFTEKGEVALSVRMEGAGGDAARLRFEVRDTGIGIPEDKLGLLFQVFSQVDGSHTRRFGGTGLGLAISKRLVELMGGHIGVETRDGQGSTFWFTLPVETAKARELRRPEPLPELKGCRVLFVDDNETNRKVLAGLMQFWGCRHSGFPDAGSALAALSEASVTRDPFQIAILDMQMCGMSGEELGKRIKADPELRETALVMMTSVGTRGDATRLSNLGFSAYLNKPVKSGHLLSCLQTVLGRVRERRANEKPLVTRHSLMEDQRKRGRILVAEDNETNRKLIIAVLGKMGYDVTVVENGLEAVSILESTSFDIVLMDVQMPIMDGLEATARIRDLNSRVLNRKIPIVALTANALSGDQERCLKLGMNDYLTKPISKEAVMRVLNHWLEEVKA